jgi:hypothetical protein
VLFANPAHSQSLENSQTVSIVVSAAIRGLKGVFRHDLWWKALSQMAQVTAALTKWLLASQQMSSKGDKGNFPILMLECRYFLYFQDKS